MEATLSIRSTGLSDHERSFGTERNSGTRHPAVADDETLLNSGQVKRLMGGVSDMWIWRRQNDPDAEFPEPTVIGNRRYWPLGEIRAWIAAQAAKGKTRGPAVGTAAVGLILLMSVAPPNLQIWAPWASVVTLDCDPVTSIARDIAIPPAFTACRATACRAGDHEMGAAIGAIDLEREQAASAAPTATTSPEAAS
jgi:predicted DNA-binding transcriptional regulator AlpA